MRAPVPFVPRPAVLPRTPARPRPTRFASFLEHDFYGNNRNFFYVEAPPSDLYRGGTQWKKRLKGEVLEGQIIPLADLDSRHINSFGYRDCAFAFSYVDFFINHDLEEWRALVRALKKPSSNTMKAVQEVHGWLPAELLWSGQGPFAGLTRGRTLDQHFRRRSGAQGDRRLVVGLNRDAIGQLIAPQKPYPGPGHQAVLCQET